MVEGGQEAAPPVLSGRDASWRCSLSRWLRGSRSGLMGAWSRQSSVSWPSTLTAVPCQAWMLAPLPRGLRSLGLASAWASGLGGVPRRPHCCSQPLASPWARAPTTALACSS